MKIARCTKKDLKDGFLRSNISCPLALALRRVTNKPVFVSYRFSRIGGIRYEHSDRIHLRLRRLDDGIPSASNPFFFIVKQGKIL